VTITVATDITTTPPRNTVTVNSGAGTVMSSVSLWRNDASGQTLLRTQPSAGFASQFVFDYECPYGVATTYGWTANYSTGLTTLFNETWANTSAWTAVGGAWTVSGGKVSNPASSPGGGLNRTIAQGKYRFTIASMANASTAGSILQLFMQDTTTSPNARVVIQLSHTGVVTVVATDYSGITTTTPTGISPTSPIVIDTGSSTMSVTGVGGTVIIPFAIQPNLMGMGGAPTATVAGVLTVGGIKVESYGTSTTITETSAAVTLAPLYGWMVHPIVPALSCKLGFNGSRIMTIASLDTITDPSNSTLHYILGSKTPIATTTGPRSGEVRSATIKVTTATEESALKAMLADETPILFNIAPSFGIQLGWGFYQVGDVSRDRQAQRPNWPGRYITMPLTAVQPPIAAVQNSGWSWAALALAFPTWASLKLAFNTWADVAANNRNPGY
jgi:hypothetical protein